LFLDQVTKVLVYGLVPQGEVVRLVSGVLQIWPVHNPRGVFGISYGPPIVYFALPLLGSALVVWFGIRARGRWPSVAYGLVLGGAVGNLVDRFRFGYVIDFIDLGLRGWHWHTFNVADAAVVAGVVLLLTRELFGRRAHEGETPVPESRQGVVPSADEQTRIPG
jgi:signal peptidase II